MSRYRELSENAARYLRAAVDDLWTQDYDYCQEGDDLRACFSAQNELRAAAGLPLLSVEDDLLPALERVRERGEPTP